MGERGKGMLERIGIWGNTSKPAVKAVAQELVDWLDTRKRRAVLAEPLAEFLGRPGSGVPEDELGGAVDVLVSLGGDGSLLHSARLVSGVGVPILGVNLGRLGFLAEISHDALPAAMEKVLQGHYQVEDRMNLEATLIRGGEPAARFLALNDVVVDRGASPRVLEFEVRIEGVPVTRYTGDGVILSTPTGSTGHSLSAGGPVVNPRARAMILTPMCAHSLAARTIIVSEEEVAEIEIHTAGREAQMAVDGQIGHAIQNEDRLVGRAAAEVTRLVRLNDTSFYEILRTKFRWGSPHMGGDE